MAIRFNFEKFEKTTLKNMDVITDTIDALLDNENYTLAWDNIVMLRSWEKFYISTGIKYKNFTYFDKYLKYILGVDTGKNIDEFKDYYKIKK